MRQLVIACLLLLTACGGVKKDHENNDEDIGPVGPWVPEDCASNSDRDDDGFHGAGNDSTVGSLRPLESL